MDTDLAPIDVALHWPFIRSHLLLERWPAAGRALDALAVQQLDANGRAVQFGTRFWTEAGLTRGQIGATTQALVELERRRVVARYSGRGRRGHSWTFVPSIRHWVAMPWSGRGRNVDDAVRSCACRAPRPVVAVIPGQPVALSRASAVFRLSSADHLQRPGLFPVEERDYGARRATTGQRPRISLVEPRDYGADPGSPYLLPGELTFSVEGARERFDALLEAVEGKCGQTVYPTAFKMRARLAALAEQLDDRQAAAVLQLFEARPDRMFVPKAVDVLADLSTDPAVRRSPRQHPAGSALGQQPVRMDLAGFLPEPVA